MGRLKDFLIRALWQDPDYEVHQVSCPQITIEQIDPILHGRLMGQASAAGAEFSVGSKATINGLEFDWNYDGEAQILNVTCTKKPFYATCSEVESRIRELVAKAKGEIL